GFGHHSKNLNAGDLTLFCPACPQPILFDTEVTSGIITTPRWKYTRLFVMDRNFKAEHLHPMKPFDEVWLSDGLGFMVGKDRYKTHLAEAADTLEKSSCSNHRAVNQANVAQPKLESTGIRGVACARHGCFIPHSMVDFQKGKRQAHPCHSTFTSQPCIICRQMNMDYALCEAAQHNMEGITRAVTFHDINCQYNKHFRECFNYQMNDFNFSQMIHMKKTLYRRYKQAKNGTAKSEKAFDRLNESAPGDSKTEWLASERITQSSRINDSLAMDVYEINIKKALSKKEIKLRLLEEGNARNAAPARRSMATWISMGLVIEEAQITLLIEVQRIGRRTTETQRLDI
ncbi:hypothetical protein EDB19DRAFT_1577066, partial [Suillus lakei]